MDTRNTAVKNKNSIDSIASAVFDNGRRGNPRPGCDCVQCFGYCMIDADEAIRGTLERAPVRTASPAAELDFDA